MILFAIRIDHGKLRGVVYLGLWIQSSKFRSLIPELIAKNFRFWVGMQLDILISFQGSTDPWNGNENTKLKIPSFVPYKWTTKSYHDIQDCPKLLPSSTQHNPITPTADGQHEHNKADDDDNTIVLKYNGIEQRLRGVISIIKVHNNKPSYLPIQTSRDTNNNNNNNERRQRTASTTTKQQTKHHRYDWL